MHIDVNFKKVITLYSTFFFSIFMTLILGELTFNELNLQFWQTINLLLFKQLNFLNIIIFLISFFGLNIIFKTISKSDLDNIELLFEKDTKSNKFIRKLLHAIRHFLR